MNFVGAPDFTHIAVAAVAAAIVGYLILWLLDRLLFRFFTDDRIAGIALSAAMTFVLMMAAGTAYLTRHFREDFGGIVIPPFGYAVAFIFGIAAASAVRMKLYGREYEFNDDQAVFEPDPDDLSRYDQEVLAWDEKHKGKGYFRRHWVGHLPLPVSYWINGLLFSTLLLAFTEFLTAKIKTGWASLQGIAAVAFSYLVASLLLWIWSSVGIWRSAYWHRRRGGTAGWGTAARALVALGAIGLVFRSEGIALQAAELGGLAMGRDSIGEIADMKVSPDGRTLILRGNISEGAADRFAALVDNSPKLEQVVLTSPGGRIFEAERMADLIRARRLNTRVDDSCMSACTNILMGGRERTAPNRARIGFHQPSFPGMTSADLRRAIEESRASYVKAGVSPYFVDRALMTPASSMWFPTADELKWAHVLTDSDIVITAGGSKTNESRAADMSLSEQRLRADLVQEAAHTNARTPVRIDEVVTLDRAAASGLTLTNYYTVRMKNLDVAGSKLAMTRLVRGQLCADNGALAAVRDGARFNYSYNDSRGRHLFDISIDRCD